MSSVLLAYEREQDLAALETVLQARGHRILKARSGPEALEAARQESPQVVLSDVLLPLLDGFTLCRRLREDPVLQHLPVFLMSFRVEGPKYESFAAEVGAERFFPRGATIEEVAAAIEQLNTGSATMRMPALVPELLDLREQDRRRFADLERHLRELQAANQQLTVAERVAREKAEHEMRERAVLTAADASVIRDLKARVRDLETRQQQLAAAESQARGAAEESRAGLARVNLLEGRLAELQTSQAHAQAAAADFERILRSHPVPTWLSDMETHEVRIASDAAAALAGIAPERMPGRILQELLPGYAPGVDPARPVDVEFARPDGTRLVLELRRQSVSHAGRACWVTSARDVTSEREASAKRDQATLGALALEASPLAAGLADAAGRLRYGNAAFWRLLGLEAVPAQPLSLASLECDRSGDSTIRKAAIGGDGQVLQELRWRRPDGGELEVEVASAEPGTMPGTRIVVVRDISVRRQREERVAREQRGLAGLLDLTQRAHSLTEAEVQAHVLELLAQLTGCETACVFLAGADAAQLELTARRGGDPAVQDLSVLTRWHGAPPADSALLECLSSQRLVSRERQEGTGVLRQAGLPGMLRRQLCAPIRDGARVAGVVLLADKPEAFDDDDRRHVEQVADGMWKVLRRRRSDAEVVSAMDHMERVMLGTVECVAALAEVQDGLKTGRARRVGELAAGIGTALGLPGHSVRGLRITGQLIDLGMLHIPREVLWRPGPLSAAEFELVKTHPERGYESLRRIEFPWPVAEAVRQHHERLDGTGYPRGLEGEEILLEARILAVADAVEAMLSPRPHRAALSLATCVEELQSQAGRRYDPRAVKACVKLLREREAHLESDARSGQRIA
jgi:HD-GYP domain-containing protein (c-di-GMP phosphodiesterase class II)/CheY-like chemotaxis protein